MTRQRIAESALEIAMAPGIFQTRIEKRHEVRVTVVGDRLFCAGIDSQSDRDTAVDWRRDQYREMYFHTDLSPEGRNRLLEFHRRAGLIFAAYDLIVTPRGEEVFLECNPGGQWLWLEQALGIDVSSALADLLAGSR